MSNTDEVIDQSNWMKHEPPMTGTCPRCGYDPQVGMCEVYRCHNIAEYEGWWKVIDPMGIPSGLIQRRRVCEVHRTMLIGGQKEVQDEQA